jgi:hypothetical protein
MKQYIKEIINQGDDSGNGMTVRFGLPSGLEIIGLPTKNFYGGHWDLGPTWNYAVLGDQPFLVDSGRFGQGKNLVDMMSSAGINSRDLEFVLISHGHEDHDGGLAELVNSTNLSIKALHWLPPDTKKTFRPSAGIVPCLNHFTQKIALIIIRCCRNWQLNPLPMVKLNWRRTFIPIIFRGIVRIVSPSCWVMKRSSWAISCYPTLRPGPPGKNYSMKSLR